jgi:hypothetical protein
MKRETKYTEMKRNVAKFTKGKAKRNETWWNLPKRNGTKWNVHKNWKGMQFSETEQNRICWNIHACSKPDKWLFLSEELWVVLFVDVHVIVGEHCLTFFSFQFQYKKTRIIKQRAYCKKVLCVCIQYNFLYRPYT